MSILKGGVVVGERKGGGVNRDSGGSSIINCNF